ncbi:MAG TPA: hypothetical protein PLG90_13470, partial [Ignavibacteria bacterium]|nr:hypothetical protein [Ignavibacteria bacterium]
MKYLFVIILFALSFKDTLCVNSHDEKNLLDVSEDNIVFDVCFDSKKYSLLTSKGLFVFQNGDIDTINIA